MLFFVSASYFYFIKKIMLLQFFGFLFLSKNHLLIFQTLLFIKIEYFVTFLIIK